MDQRFRRGFTAAEKTELWDRWQRGDFLGNDPRYRLNLSIGRRGSAATAARIYTNRTQADRKVARITSKPLILPTFQDYHYIS